jgi:hypothetical protein
MTDQGDTDDTRTGSHGDGCDGCAKGDTDGAIDTGTGRWLDRAEPLSVPLPPAVRAPLGRVLGEPPIATIEAWLGAVRRHTGGGAIDVEMLCHADGETPHRGRMDGETYHFQCFYDAVALSVLAEGPVTIRTESPEGAEIRGCADGDDLAVTPADAVFSFGVATDVTPPADGEPTLGAIYDAICPYVKAFPDRAAYERWAGTVPAVTVGLPLAGATDIAAALAAERPG